MATVIPLTRGYVTVVDDEDAEWVKQRSWSAHVKRTGVYARSTFERSGRKFHVFLHRFILGLTEIDALVDHIDGDGLNNQRHNLRTCTPAENARHRTVTKNLTGFRGVHRHWKKVKGGPRRKLVYRAELCVEGVTRKFSETVDPVRAARAYDEAALKYHGEFACTNVMLGLLPPREVVNG